MSTNIDWAKLVSEGRAKAVGIGWSEKELEAIHKNKMSADDVRAGFFTKAQKEKYLEKLEKENKKLPLDKMAKKELVKIAKELKIEFNEKVVNAGDLVIAIKQKQEETKGDNKPEESKNEEKKETEIKTDGKDAKKVEQKADKQDNA